MKLTIRIFAIAILIAGLGITAAFAQGTKKAPDYSIPTIQVNAFDEAAGELSDAIPDKSEPKYFFNDLSTSLFVWVMIQGEPGSFEPGRMANVVVLEGKKIKITRNVQIGLIGDKGLYFVPVYVYGSLCSQVTITAKITGQKTRSPKSVKIPFNCGE